MNDRQYLPARGRSSAWRAASRRLLPNLLLFGGLLALGVANFHFHERHPVIIAWLPSGLAFGVVLLRGLHMLPAVILGTGSVVLLLVGDVVAAVTFGLANGAACAIGLALVGLGKPVNFRRMTVRGTGKVLLAGCASYLLAAYVLGPYSVSQLIKHDHHEVPHGSITAVLHAHDATEKSAHATKEHGAHDHAPPGSPHAVDDTLERLLIDAIGVLLVTPFVLYCRSWRNNPFKGMRERYRGAIMVTALLMTVTVAIYAGYLEKNFGLVHTTLLILPPAVWLALEYDLGYSLFSNVAVNLLVSVGSSLGHGPFKDHSSGLPLIIVVFSLTVLLIAASRAERKTAEETIHRLATEDALTGVPNRSSFTRQFGQAIQGARRCNYKVAVMFIDLDYFKRVNDSLGHQVGDMLLVEVARRVRSCLRGDSTLARFGGDEFVILVDHVDARDALVAIAQRVAETISMPFQLAGYTCNVACSIGISIYPDDGDTVSELMMKADIAMYEVKARGRNGHSFYSADMKVAVDMKQQRADHGLT